MATISNGRSRFILWQGSAYTLSGSALDAGQTSVFQFDSGGIVRSFRAGRNPSFNNLSNLQQWRSYQVSAIGLAVTLPQASVAGLGVAPGSTPAPTGVLIGMNI